MPDPSPEPTPADPLHGLNPAAMMDLALTPGQSGASSVAVPDPEALGALLPGYVIHAVTGRGGMGAVYRATQKNLGRTVAIKVLPVDLGDTPGFAERFHREALTTAGLAHPDIVAVHDAGETVAGHHYYVMDYVDGEDLAVTMARARMPVEESVPLLATVCGAVEAAHARGIIHRDIKPSNILLTKEGKPKLADFGLALLTEKHLEYSRLTLGGTTMGTLEYAAPEQLAGTGATMASDQYSLGVLAYELLTGELPRGVFDAPSVRNAEIDPAFDGVILRALQSDPARRFGSVADFRAALLLAADRRAQQERRDAEARGRLRRRTLVAAAAAVVALLTVGLALFAWKQSRRAETGESEANERRVAAEAAQKETEDVMQFLLTDLRKRLEKTGNLSAMESVLERAIAHFRTKYTETGHSPQAAVQLADALAVKGDVYAVRALPAEAMALFEEACTLAEEARDKEPGNPARQLRVVQAWRRRSEQKLGLGRYQECLDDARRMLAEAQKLEGPAAPLAVAAAHRAVANAFGYLLKIDDARGEYLQARSIFAAAQEREPDNKNLAAEYADIDMSLGSLAEANRDYPLMLQHFRAWHEFVQRTYPADSNMYSHAAFRLGHALVLNNRAGEAAPLLWEAILIAERDVAAQPGHRGNLNHLRLCMDIYARAQDQLGEAGSAAEMRRRIQAVDAALAAAPERDPAAGDDRVEERLKEAEQRLFSRLEANPEDDATQFAWAMASEDVGKHIESARGPEAAAQHYLTQIIKVESRLASAPPDTWWNLGLSYTLNRLGVLKEGAGAWAEAEPIFRRALECRRRTLAAHPGDPRDCRNVASTAARLARTFLHLQRPAEADALWRELFPALKPIPGDSGFEWRALLVSYIPETMAALEPDAARSLADTARDFLLARGADALTKAEQESLAALQQAVPQ